MTPLWGPAIFPTHPWGFHHPEGVSQTLTLARFFVGAAAASLVSAGLGCAAGAPGYGGGVIAADTRPDSALTPSLTRYLQSRGVDDATAYYRPHIAVLPFADDSGFRRGIWDVEHEFPRLLTAVMEGGSMWRMVPYEAVIEVVGKPRRWRDRDAVEAGQVLRADVVLLGSILDLNMERLHVGDPLVGGYKSYKGTAELEVTAYRVDDGSAVGAVHGREESTQRGLGLDLLGKPREQDYQFANLNKMAFGSEEFRETAVGQAVVAVIDEVVEKLATKLRPEGVELADEAPRVLSVYGDEIFINLGSENAVRRGYRFAVIPGPARRQRDGLDGEVPVGVVEVLDVIGARVSRVRALGDRQRVEPGDELRQIDQRPDAPAAESGSEGGP